MTIAIDFDNRFTASSEIDYGWVLSETKERLDKIDKGISAIDEKALSLIGYFGNGAGLIALAAGYATSVGTLSAPVFLVATPSLLCALAAVIIAMICRRTVELYQGPTAPSSVTTIHSLKELNIGSASRVAEQETISTKWLNYVRNSEVLKRKAEVLDYAIWGKIASLSFLVFPLGLIAYEKCVTPPAILNSINISVKLPPK